MIIWTNIETQTYLATLKSNNLGRCNSRPQTNENMCITEIQMRRLDFESEIESIIKDKVKKAYTFDGKKGYPAVTVEDSCARCFCLEVINRGGFFAP